MLLSTRIRASCTCGLAQHADLGTGTILVAQLDDIVYDLRKVGMAGGLSIAGKGQHVRQLPLGCHLLQLGLELEGYLLAGRHGQGRAVVFVEAALAVDAVETAHLAVSRQQVDAK